MGHKISQPPVEARALRVREAIERYRIGKTKLYDLMNEGKLASVKVGGTRLIPVDALEALIGEVK